MPLKVPNEGEIPLLDYLAAGYFPGLTLGLFKNDHTPADSDTLSDYTPADFDGYSEILSLSFDPAVTIGDKAVVNGVDPYTFTCTGDTTSNDIYGYYVHDGVSVIWAQRAASPFTISEAGQTYTVTLQFTLDSEY